MARRRCTCAAITSMWRSGWSGRCEEAKMTNSGARAFCPLMSFSEVLPLICSFRMRSSRQICSLQLAGRMPALRNLAILLCVFVPLWLSASYAADIPTIADAVLEQALTLAGDNRAELEAALDECVQKPYCMQAQRFVITSLPLADLGKISAA